MEAATDQAEVMAEARHPGTMIVTAAMAEADLLMEEEATDRQALEPVLAEAIRRAEEEAIRE